MKTPFTITDDTTSTAVELITLDEAKRHLRVGVNSFDVDIHQKLLAARHWAEQMTGRTLVTSWQRTLAFSGWPDDMALPYPPLKTIDSVKYYDANNADQTLASSEYRTILSADGKGWIDWDETFTCPDVYDRNDAVRIQFTSGYASLPESIKQAILLKLTVYWGQDTDQMLMASGKMAAAIIDSELAHTYV